MLQLHNYNSLPKINGSKICILQSKWYSDFTNVMTLKCAEILESAGAEVEIHILPGCLEFALAAQIILDKKKMDGIICLGVLMKGDTDHYEMILNSCVIGLQQVSLEKNVPIFNGILPVTSHEQVVKRASDNDQNKGIEVAIATAEFIAWRSK